MNEITSPKPWQIAGSYLLLKSINRTALARNAIEILWRAIAARDEQIEGMKNELAYWVLEAKE